MSSITTLLQGEPISFNFLDLPEEAKDLLANKRKAPEAAENTIEPKKQKEVESLDDDDADVNPDASKTTNPITEKHAYFEPRWCSDIEICYQGYVFHCHKVSLVNASDYFNTALSGDHTCSRLEIPELKTFGIIIGGVKFYQFLKAIYTGSIDSKVSITFFSHLTDYFRCEKLQQAWIGDVKSIPRKKLFIWLAVALEYKWKQRQDIFNRTVEVLGLLFDDWDEMDDIKLGWGRLSVETKLALALSYLNKGGGRVKVPKELLPSIS
jgi:hypothetical protein